MAEITAPIEQDTPARTSILLAQVRQFMTPTAVVCLLLALLLIFLVANPLFQLVKESLTDAKTGGLTLMNYVAAFARPRYVPPGGGATKLRPVWDL